MKKKVVGSLDLMPSWFEKFSRISAEIWRQLLLGLKNPGKGLTLDQLQALVEHRNPFVGLQETAKPIYDDVVIDWQNFYEKHFDLRFDFSNVHIPKRPEGSWRLLMITGILLEQLYAKCKELFPCWRWTEEDLDKKVTWNEREAKGGTYAIWVRDEQEADENLRNLSADDIKARGVKTETLAERLIHELKFHDETGKHLDVDNVTLGAGSCYDDGRIPSVDWSGGKVHVSWYYSGLAGGSLRARQVVS